MPLVAEQPSASHPRLQLVPSEQQAQRPAQWILERLESAAQEQPVAQLAQPEAQPA